MNKQCLKCLKKYPRIDTNDFINCYKCHEISEYNKKSKKEFSRFLDFISFGFFVLAGFTVADFILIKLFPNVNFGLGFGLFGVCLCFIIYNLPTNKKEKKRDSPKREIKQMKFISSLVFECRDKFFHRSFECLLRFRQIASQLLSLYR